MSNDELAAKLASVRTKSTAHMETGERASCIGTMLDDLEQLARSDGCIAAAWAIEIMPVLVEQLAPDANCGGPISAEWMSRISPETIKAAERLERWRRCRAEMRENCHEYAMNRMLQVQDETALIDWAVARLAADRAELERDKSIRESVAGMVDICLSDEADEQERDMAASTILEAVRPSMLAELANRSDRAERRPLPNAVKQTTPMAIHETVEASLVHVLLDEMGVGSTACGGEGDAEVRVNVYERLRMAMRMLADQEAERRRSGMWQDRPSRDGWYWIEGHIGPWCVGLFEGGWWLTRGGTCGGLLGGRRVFPIAGPPELPSKGGAS